MTNPEVVKLLFWVHFSRIRLRRENSLETCFFKKNYLGTTNSITETRVLMVGGRSRIIWILISFMIPVVFASMIHDSYKNSDSRRHLTPIDLVSFCILWCSNFFFIQTWYHHSFCLGMEIFCNWTLSTRLLEKQADCQLRMHELYTGVWGHVPPEKMFENWTLVNAISCIPWIERN